MRLDRDRLQALYLDWVNNFLSVPAFADYYGFTLSNAQRIINVGRLIHETRVVRF